MIPQEQTAPSVILEAIADGAPGGGITHVLGLARSFAESGHEVHLVTEQNSYAARKGLELGATIHQLNFSSSRFNPFLYRQVRRILRQVQPNILHVHGARAGLPFSNAIGSTDCRSIYTVHGYHHLKKAWFARLLGAEAEKYISRKLETTVFVSEHDRSTALGHRIVSPRGSHLVIHNGIDPISSSVPMPSKSGRDIAFVGRLVEPKNPLFLVDIAKHLTLDDVRIVVVGGGELEKRLTQKIAEEGLSERFVIVGEVTHVQALHHLMSCRLMIMPSLWEGLPLAPLESMAMEIPVIASPVGGIPEIIEHERNGFLLPLDDAKAYADLIEHLFQNIEQCKAIGLEARKTVMDGFSVDTMLTKYYELYGLALPIQSK